MKLIDQVLATRPQVDEWRGEPVLWYEKKLDGRRVTVVKDHGLVAIGRKRYIDLMPQLCENDEFLRVASHLPERTALDGELHVPGCPASDVMTAVKEGVDFVYSPFAAPMVARESMKGIDLPNIHLLIKKLGFFPPPLMYYERLVGSSESIKDLLCRNAEAGGFEGYVLKRTGWGEWYKVKPTKTADLIVTDWQEGSGKYVGMMGALEGSLADGTVIASVGGGYSDAQRSVFTREYCVGKVMEVTYDRVESQGRLRFPRFKCWRDDKSASECVTV